MNAPNNSENTALAVVQGYDLSPRNFDEAWRLAEIMADSGMVPKDYEGKPGKCLIAVQWGAEVGLKPMQSVQNIAVINNRPSLWGDAMLALVRASPLCRYVIESDDGTTATCRSWRHGEPQEQVRTFSMEDAKQAGLMGKQGPWANYPKRMRQMRARAFLLRDVYTDVLKGLHMAEEAMDMPVPEKFMGPADVIGQQQARGADTTAHEPAYPQADFDANVAAWSKVIEGGKKTAAQIIAMVNASGKGALTEPQKAKLLSVKSKSTDATDKGAKGGDAFTAPTYAEVAGKLTAAKNLDELNEGGDLIKSVADEGQRTELQALFNNREAEIIPKE